MFVNRIPTRSVFALAAGLFLGSCGGGLGVGFPTVSTQTDRETMDKRLTPAVMASKAVKDVEAAAGISYKQIPICNDGPPHTGRDGTSFCRTTVVFPPPGEVVDIPRRSKEEIKRFEAIAAQVRAEGFWDNDRKQQPVRRAPVKQRTGPLSITPR